MTENLAQSRRYTIEMTDVATGKAVVLHRSRPDGRRVVVTQIIRLAGAPDDTRFTDWVAPKP